MRDAMDSVFDGMLANKAAYLHGVLRSTLEDRTGGKIVYERNPGLKLYLNSEEEKNWWVIQLKLQILGMVKLVDVIIHVETMWKRRKMFLCEVLIYTWLVADVFEKEAFT